MPRLDETQPALDPADSLDRAGSFSDSARDPLASLDEAYELAPPPVDGEHLRARFAPRPPDAATLADVIPLSPEPLPDVPRSSPLGLPAGDLSAARASKPVRYTDPARFTLRNLLFVITMASVVLAIGIRFPRPYFAGAAGLAALLTAVSASWLRGGGAVLQLAWWTLLGIYLMACGFALLGL